mgnify:CR=1 FL=1
MVTLMFRTWILFSFGLSVSSVFSQTSERDSSATTSHPIAADEWDRPELPRITLLVWNVAKRVAARDELTGYAKGCDIICLQEYVPGIQAGDVPHSEFASSFRSWFSGKSTGVCTISQQPHVGSMAIRSRWREGYILTPKMTLVSTHAFGESRLMVVNLHGMNFQPFFTYMLRQQLFQIAESVEQHKGPVIVCGDFNTWSRRRQQLVDVALSDCQQVDFPKHEHRKTADWFVSLVGGNPTLPLDHVYTRGIRVVDPPKVLVTKHSDHAPLKVTLELATP